MTDEIGVFSRAVQTEFAFLESRFGFRRIGPRQSSTAITYETDAHYVSIALDRRQDVLMQFGRRGVDDVVGGYGLETGDLVQLDPAWRWDRVPEMDQWISQLAELLGRCAEAGLFDDPSIIKAMKARRREDVEAWHRDERERPIRLKAEAAWRDQDDKSVAEALGGIEESLTEGETRRLDYARKHG